MRTLSLRQWQTWLFWRHLAAGAALYLPSTHPLIRNTHDTIASEAMIMVGDPASALPDLAPLFGTNAPPCAKGLVPITNLHVLFRSPWKSPE
ncbi:hypothetical protein HY285_00310 [Candidatus Peregrinibacteria bacterium]|nr:hypothetical protein [Candidatus Peregrinibacteria bacterium]MBI3815976.1 hypothetical protein [Candidatus Peregrinibacteria bacterium]